MGFLQSLAQGIKSVEQAIGTQQPAPALRNMLTVPAAPVMVPSQPVNAGIMQANGHFTAPAPRTLQKNLPQVQSPQNLQQYGNVQGQHWMENSQGQKFAMPQLQPYNTVGDQRIVPSSNHYNRPVVAAPQWQSAPGSQAPVMRTI